MSRFMPSLSAGVLTTPLGYAVPLTGSASIWASPAASYGGGWFFSTRNASPLRVFELYYYSDGNIYAGWYNDGTDKRVVASGSYFTSGWHNFVVTWVNSGYTRLYIDGTERGTATSGLNATYDTSGSVFNVANQILYPVSNVNLNVGMMAIWDEELTADEAVALGRGIYPLRVRPLALTDFWPIHGYESAEPNYISGRQVLDQTSTLYSNAPPVSRPWAFVPFYDAPVARPGDFMPTFSRILTMQK